MSYSQDKFSIRKFYPLAYSLILLVALTNNSVAESVFDPTISRNQRLEFAKEIDADIRIISNVVPTMKPADRNWLNAERAAAEKIQGTPGWGMRLFAIHNSIEGKHAGLFDSLANIEETIKCILRANVSLSREIFCWGVLAYQLTDREAVSPTLIRELELAKLIPQGSQAVERAALADIKARRIQEVILLRHLASN